MRQREWLGGGPQDFSRRLVGFRRDHSVRRRCTGTPSVRPSQTLRSAPLAFLLPIAIAGTSQLSKLRDAQCCGGTSTSAFLHDFWPIADAFTAKYGIPCLTTENWLGIEGNTALNWCFRTGILSLEQTHGRDRTHMRAFYYDEVVTTPIPSPKIDF